MGHKVFREMCNVGAVRYLVNFHDGQQTHRDGSPFYDTRMFRNRRAKDAFVKTLRAAGYREE